MLDQLTEAIRIADLARFCRLSPAHFVRAFTNTVGVAPYAWFLGERVAKAKRLLADTMLPLAQIALECGFSDQAHFTKAFGKAAGLTPARWRKLSREKSPAVGSSLKFETRAGEKSAIDTC